MSKINKDTNQEIYDNLVIWNILPSSFFIDFATPTAIFAEIIWHSPSAILTLAWNRIVDWSRVQKNELCETA